MKIGSWFVSSIFFQVSPPVHESFTIRKFDNCFIFIFGAFKLLRKDNKNHYFKRDNGRIRCVTLEYVYETHPFIQCMYYMSTLAHPCNLLAVSNYW